MVAWLVPNSTAVCWLSKPGHHERLDFPLALRQRAMPAARICDGRPLLTGSAGSST
jgi:hypothetical protein